MGFSIITPLGHGIVPFATYIMESSPCSTVSILIGDNFAPESA